MQITTFNINPTRTAIDLTITDASGVVNLNLWTDKTYKDYNKVIDLSSKLNGSNIQDITIQLNDLNISYFDGVYFIEAESNDDTSSAITADLTRYEECILNKTLEISICEDCFTKKSNSVINSHVLLTSLQDAIEQGFTDEIFTIVKALNKYCSNECKSCGGYKNQSDNNYYKLPLLPTGGSGELDLAYFTIDQENIYEYAGSIFNIYQDDVLTQSFEIVDPVAHSWNISLDLNRSVRFDVEPIPTAFPLQVMINADSSPTISILYVNTTLERSVYDSGGYFTYAGSDFPTIRLRQVFPT